MSQANSRVKVPKFMIFVTILDGTGTMPSPMNMPAWVRVYDRADPVAGRVGNVRAASAGMGAEGRAVSMEVEGKAV